MDSLQRQAAGSAPRDGDQPFHERTTFQSSTRQQLIQRRNPRRQARPRIGRDQDGPPAKLTQRLQGVSAMMIAREIIGLCHRLCHRLAACCMGFQPKIAFIVPREKSLKHGGTEESRNGKFREL